MRTHTKTNRKQRSEIETHIYFCTLYRHTKEIRQIPPFRFIESIFAPASYILELRAPLSVKSWISFIFSAGTESLLIFAALKTLVLQSEVVREILRGSEGVVYIGFEWRVATLFIFHVSHTFLRRNFPFSRRGFPAWMMGLFNGFDRKCGFL